MNSDKKTCPHLGTSFFYDTRIRCAQHYQLDCHAALAMNPSEAQDAARTQSAGDTRAGTIYYLCSIIYALKNAPVAHFFI